MSGLYILDGQRPVPCDDVSTWGRWCHETDRHVGLAIWGDPDGAEVARVSTVFLGVDHGWGPGPPILFETMVFTPDLPRLDQHQWRARTWEEAAEHHEIACALVRLALAEVGGPAVRADHEHQTEGEQPGPRKPAPLRYAGERHEEAHHHQDQPDDKDRIP